VADKMFGISLQNDQAKYLLVAVLAAILLAVIAWPGESSPATPGAKAAATSEQHPTATSGIGSSTAQSSSSAPVSAGGIGAGGEGAAAKTEPKPAAKTLAKKQSARKAFTPLTEDELASTLSFNPFVPSALLQAQLPGQSTVATQQAQEDLAEKARALAVEQRLNEFRSKKVSVVFRTADGTSAALIGDKQVVREGEVIDGIRILSISHEGVVVEVVPPPSGVGF